MNTGTRSEIDPRVRALSFVVKHWAKKRYLNDPAAGTLSSYGFILCVIHFLQTRPVPLVPNLQSLPPNWSMQHGFTPKTPFSRPSVICLNASDQPCETYFFGGDGYAGGANAAAAQQALSALAQRNNESTAEIGRASCRERV